MTDFQEELVLILVQYLAVGLLVALAGYLFSRSLEHYKAREAVAGELAKQRIKVIAECWSEMYKWEAILNSFIRRSEDLQREHANARDRLEVAVRTELAPVEKRSKEQASATRAKVDESRFWLGETLYAEFRDYSNNLMEYGKAYAEDNHSRFNALEAEIELGKGNLSKAMAEAS